MFLSPPQAECAINQVRGRKGAEEKLGKTCHRSVRAHGRTSYITGAPARNRGYQQRLFNTRVFLVVLLYSRLNSCRLLVYSHSNMSLPRSIPPRARSQGLTLLSFIAGSGWADPAGAGMGSPRCSGTAPAPAEPTPTSQLCLFSYGGAKLLSVLPASAPLG